MYVAYVFVWSLPRTSWRIPKENNKLVSIEITTSFLLQFPATCPVYMFLLLNLNGYITSLYSVCILILTLWRQLTRYTHGLDFMLHSKYTSAPSRIEVEFKFVPNSNVTTGVSVISIKWFWLLFFQLCNMVFTNYYGF